MLAEGRTEGFCWEWREARFKLKQISCSDTDELGAQPATAVRHCLGSVPDAEWELGRLAPAETK